MEDCKHTKFECHASVIRLHEEETPEIITGYTSDITITCMECGTPFQFVGVPGGVSPNQPMVNFDSTKLRAPLVPMNMKKGRKISRNSTYN